MEKGNVAGSGASQDQGQDADQTQTAGGTKTRDPWAGVPDLGETTLPDGTTLRRDGDGRFWRTDENGNESQWDPEAGRWMRPEDWTESPGTESWGDPSQQWDEAWGGGSKPEGWQDAPRAGTTNIAEGTLSRDSSGTYELRTPDQTLRWNEQSGKWYDSSSGREVAHPLDPVAGWQRGAETDAYQRAHPDQPHPYKSQPGARSGPVRP